ncbi:MAG: alpha/beta hydrolase [Gammaproteobacteria bacterium]|nr:alpha/beta hydrolase [Gammaproteobacteria bacterium]
MNEHVISRDFVSIGERQVHFRSAGSGPPLIMLHQSPRSSAELVPMMRILASRFLVIAPDTPGCGLSDPIQPADTEPTIDDFVEALIAFIDALGLERVAVFGSHTGAIIGVRLAYRYPDRIAALVANGIMLATPDERAEQTERYFPRFAPQWDGGHLAWMWSRLRDQLIFYPWYQRDPGHRINWEQSLEEIDEGALDLLDAGDNYRGAYLAVVSYAIAADLSLIETPSLLLVAKKDALSYYVDQYPALPEGVEVSVVPEFADIPHAALSFLLRHAPPLAQIARAGAGARRRLSSSFVDLGDGRVCLRSGTAANGKPFIVLHDLGASAAGLDVVLGGALGRRPVLAPDLPGCGESDGFGAVTPADIAKVILRLADALGLASFDLAAIGASAAIALAIRELAPDRVGAIVVADPMLAPADADAGFARRFVPDLTPDISGSHLFRAWNFLRDRELFFPWYDRSAQAIVALARPSRAVDLHRGLIGLLKARKVYAQQLEAALQCGTVQALDAPGVTILATPGSPARRTGLSCGALPDDRHQWGPALLRATG